ncbi:MAG: hypothetical protein Q7U28_09480 [Aquabacterium sp.]|nr:hypothetical protein [Aquabacterium sp.]
MDEISNTQKKPNGVVTTTAKNSSSLFILFAGLHVLCCGLPLLLLSGVSFQFLLPTWSIAGGILVVLGIVGFAWYAKRGCATCPRNEAGACAMKR